MPLLQQKYPGQQESSLKHWGSSANPPKSKPEIASRLVLTAWSGSEHSKSVSCFIDFKLCAFSYFKDFSLDS